VANVNADANADANIWPTNLSAPLVQEWQFDVNLGAW
jgi:hypothetical protein